MVCWLEFHAPETPNMGSLPDELVIELNLNLKLDLLDFVLIIIAAGV